MRLKGKRALITGAGQGFGRGMAERFVAEGARVAVVDILADKAEEVAGALGPAAVSVVCDVTDADQVQAAVGQAVAGLGGVDIVVNNAGWSYPNQPSLQVDYATFRKLYAINVDSIFHMTHAVVPLWRASGAPGVMLNIGSTAGISPRPNLSWYNSTKGAVHVMTQSLAAELAPEGIRVNAIAPVLGRTALTGTFMGGETPEKMEAFLSTIPLGRMSQPSDIAAAAVYLCADEAAFITGVILPVDGGRTI